MGRYSVGQRVKDPDGDLCEIIGKPYRGSRELRIHGGKNDGLVFTLPKSCLEPANDVLPCPKISETAYTTVGDNGDKLTVGVRVRLTEDNEGFGSKGDEGVVVRFHADGDARVEFDREIRDQREWWAPVRRLEPVVAPATTWTPKVGDKVRWLGKFASSMYTTGKEYSVHREQGTTLFVTDDTTDNMDHSWDAESIAANFELVPPLTIEAGKFYRTRDGRKVGPLVKNDWDEEHPFECSVKFEEPEAVSVAIWEPDGTNYEYRWLDLVAEWVEPAEVAVAEATATPFKKGDRLLCVNADGTTIVKVGETYVASEDQDGEFVDMPEGMYANRFVLAPEPAAPPAKFKVGDRVRVLTDRWYGFHKGSLATVTAVLERHTPIAFNASVDNGGDDFPWFFEASELAPAPTIPIGATVTFTATGRLSAYTTDGHAQIVFPGLTPGQNSFALPAKFVTAA